MYLFYLLSLTQLCWFPTAMPTRTALAGVSKSLTTGAPWSPCKRSFRITNLIAFAGHC